MRKKTEVIGFLLLLLPFAGYGALIPFTLNIPTGAQVDIPLSNSNPNYFEVQGDRITGVTSSAGMLTDKSNTAVGGAFVSTTQVTPFTLYITTEGGLTFSFNASPQKVPGRSYRIAATQSVNRDAAKKWEEAQAYESMLVNLNRSLRQGLLPEGYADITTDNTSLKMPSGLNATMHKAWEGHSLRVVYWHVTNKGTMPVPLREQDFWKQGVRSIMFDFNAGELSGSAATGVWVTSSQESVDGQH